MAYAIKDPESNVTEAQARYLRRLYARIGFKSGERPWWANPITYADQVTDADIVIGISMLTKGRASQVIDDMRRIVDSYQALARAHGGMRSRRAPHAADHEMRRKAFDRWRRQAKRLLED